MQALENNPNNNSRSSPMISRSKMLTMRKYSISICLLELVAIIILFYLLVTNYYSSNDSHKNYSSISFNHSYRIYSYSSRSARFLLHQVPNCNQRKHDFLTRIQCYSSRLDSCPKIENDPPASLTGAQMMQVISTSKTGDRLKVQTVELKRIVCNPKQLFHDPCYFKTTIRLKPEKLGQKIIGWGGALSDSSINNILSLTTNGTRRLLDDYFGSNGLRYNMIRITIGGSDFSSRFYTNDDAQEPDLTLSMLKFEEEDIMYKIPMIKLIQNEYNSSGNLKLFASMWSPPKWMKTNDHFNQGQLKGSISSQSTDLNQPPEQEIYYKLLSELKVKFLEYYMENSIRFWGLTVMNEPLFSIQPFLNFNTMIFPRDDYANYVAKYLGPKIRLNPRLKHLKLMAHDDNRRYLMNYTMPILNNSTIKQYIDGVSVHGYVDEAYDQMDIIYKSFHNINNTEFFILPTELSAGHLPFMEKALVGNWARGMFYAIDIVHSLQHSASGWVDWNMVLDAEGGPGWLGGRLDAPIIVDKASDVYYKNPMYYVIGQFSRYIPPSSIKVEAEITNANFDNHFEAITFVKPSTKPDHPNQYTTVIVNNNPYPVEFVIQFKRKKFAEEVETAFIYECSADSVTTLLYIDE